MPASAHCLRKARSSASAATVSCATCWSRSAIPKTPALPAQPSDCSAMLRHWFAAPRCGRSARSIVRGLNAARRNVAPLNPIPRSSPNGRRRASDTMLICFGLGYSAQYFVEIFGQKFDRIVGTVRGAERAAALNAHPSGRLKAFIFDGAAVVPDLRSAIAEADTALVSVPPDENGDPVLRACGDDLARAQRLSGIVYLSTLGVYGDYGGAWVDEATPSQPGAARSRDRLAAEQAWLEFGARHNIAVAILRLAGIYGPGQNAVVQNARGRAPPP